jgi:hypothetical protein
MAARHECFFSTGCTAFIVAGLGLRSAARLVEPAWTSADADRRATKPSACILLRTASTSAQANFRQAAPSTLGREMGTMRPSPIQLHSVSGRICKYRQCSYNDKVGGNSSSACASTSAGANLYVLCPWI